MSVWHGFAAGFTGRSSGTGPPRPYTRLAFRRGRALSLSGPCAKHHLFEDPGGCPDWRLVVGTLPGPTQPTSCWPSPGGIALHTKASDLRISASLVAEMRSSRGNAQSLKQLNTWSLDMTTASCGLTGWIARIHWIRYARSRQSFQNRTWGQAIVVVKELRFRSHKEEGRFFVWHLSLCSPLRPGTFSECRNRRRMQGVIC